MTTAELIAKLSSEDPHGVREVVVWDSDEELAKGVEQVVLRDEHVVIRIAHKALPLPHRDFR